VFRSILGMPMFCELCSPLHQSEEQHDTVPPSHSFLYYATCWNGGEKEENYGWGKSVSILITGRKVFHILFML